MSIFETSMLIRNLLLLQLLTIFVVPDYAFQVHQKLCKFWKSIVIPVRLMIPTGKREKFWEIDMTKFEP